MDFTGAFLSAVFTPLANPALFTKMSMFFNSSGMLDRNFSIEAYELTSNSPAKL
jgi:hypothetical protein